MKDKNLPTDSEINELMFRLNNRKIDDFEGLSSLQMHAMVYEPFEENCPITLENISADELCKIPILQIAKEIINYASSDKGIKLTAIGYVPPAIVKGIYSKGYLLDEHIESGVVKLTKEKDWQLFETTRAVLELSGIIKNRQKYLSITKKGREIENDNVLLSAVIKTYVNKFNIAYYDGYPENGTGQMGVLFSMFLLLKYGKKSRENNFYGEKYFTAFPDLLNDFNDTYRSRIDAANSCYSVRTFDRFLKYFGLIEIEKSFLEPSKIRATNLLWQMIKEKSAV